jgi:non-specific serine/threonine protein kinase
LEPTAGLHDAAATREEELRGSASRPVLEGHALDRVIAESALSVVYLGTDLALRLPVAVKEYLPQRLARRHSAALVVPLPGETQRFERGLRAFIDEARTLARCEHPSLLRVVRLVESHGTAYRVMPHLAGQRLDEVRRRRGAPLDGPVVRRLLESLLDALQAWQLVAGVHGRVVPDNILVLLDGRPLLMGPGAVEAALAPERRGASTTGARAVASSDGWPVGPWVDVHAVAQVGRFCITGEWPEAGIDAAAEPLHDAMRRLGLLGPRLGLDPSLVDAIAVATSPEPHLRPQSGAQLREWLAHGPPAGLAAVDVPLDVGPDPEAAAQGGLALPGLVTPVDSRRDVAGPAAPIEVPWTPPDEGSAAFEGPPDEVVIARDVAPAAGFAPPGVARTATPTARASPAHASSADDSPPSPGPAPAARPVPQLTPELASLAGRLAAQRQELPVEDVDRGGNSVLPGARRQGTAGGLARRSGVPTWAYALIALAVVVALGVVLLVDQQPVRVEGWTPEGALAGAGHEARPALANVPGATRTTPAPPAPMDVPAASGDAGGTTGSTATLDGRAPAPSSPTELAGATPAVVPPTDPETPRAPPAGDEVRTRAATQPSTRAPHAPGPAPAKAARAAPAVAGPREACGERTQFSLYRCMQTQCTQGRWHAHPQCVRFRKTDEIE